MKTDKVCENALDAYVEICNLLNRNREGLTMSDIDLNELSEEMKALRSNLIEILNIVPSNKNLLENYDFIPSFILFPEIP